MSPSAGTLVQIWGWGSLALVLSALGGGLGALLVTAAPGVSAHLVESLITVAWTFVAVLPALVVAFPLGLAVAVAVDQVLPPGRLLDTLRRLLAAMDGVPSLVIGVAFALIVQRVGLAVGAIVLGLSIAPTMALGVGRVLRRTEPAERLAAQALGATPMQVLLLVVGPGAFRGLAAVLLRAVARLSGLAAPLLVLRWDGPRPIALEAFHRAATGELAHAALLGLALLGLAVAFRGAAALVDRPIRWRLP